MKYLLLAVFFVSFSASASEGCDTAARYAGLGFIDAKNNMPEKNRLEEIDIRVDKVYREAASKAMRLGRDFYKDNPKSNQGEVENYVKRECNL